MNAQIGRRQLVRTAAGVAAGGALVLGAGAESASASSDDHGDGKGLQGTWVVDHTDDPPGDPNPGRIVAGLAAGGVFSAYDLKPPGPGALGAWRTTSHNRFRATSWGSVAGTGGDPDITYRFRIRGKLQGGQITGTYQFTGFGPDDSELFSGTGTFTGTRLAA